jgi:hypothetical protein
MPVHGPDLILMLVLKFDEGGWVTVLLTGGLAARTLVRRT